MKIFHLYLLLGHHSSLQRNEFLNEVLYGKVQIKPLRATMLWFDSHLSAPPYLFIYYFDYNFDSRNEIERNKSCPMVKRQIVPTMIRANFSVSQKLEPL